jgi:hypothetical protein
MTMNLVLHWTRWSCCFARTIMCSLSVRCLKEVIQRCPASTLLFVVTSGIIHAINAFVRRRLSSAAGHLHPGQPRQQRRRSTCSQPIGAKFQRGLIVYRIWQFSAPASADSVKFSCALVARNVRQGRPAASAAGSLELIVISPFGSKKHVALCHRTAFCVRLPSCNCFVPTVSVLFTLSLSGFYAEVSAFCLCWLLLPTTEVNIDTSCKLLFRF